MIQAWQEAGYTVKLIFLALPNAEMALARVAARVSQGGHNVPETVVRRRFVAGIRNLDRYKLLVNVWQLYDNSGAPPIFAGRRMNDMKAPVSHSKDPDLQKAPQALLRASEKARLLAEQTGTPFIVRQPAKPSVTTDKRK